MPNSTGTDPTTIAAWLASAASLFGIAVGVAKARAATRDRIDNAAAEGTEAKTAVTLLEQKMLENELAHTERYASIPHLSSVERRVTEEVKAVETRTKEAMTAMEERLVAAIKERRERFHHKD